MNEIWTKVEDGLPKPKPTERVLGICAGEVHECWITERRGWRLAMNPLMEADIKAWTPMPKPPKGL
jgi:hypothetical protein